METNNEPIQIKLELGLHNAAAIRHVLFKEQERYTYDPKSVPSRITFIREVIADLDNKIDALESFIETLIKKKQEKLSGLSIGM